MTRPPFYAPDGTFPSPAWTAQYGFRVTSPQGKVVHSYTPSPKQLDYHESTAPNCILEGSRGTGKSLCLRNDCHMRALAYPGYTYLIVRRTFGELRKSHLRFMAQEMAAMGGTFHKTDAIAHYPNGSQGFYASCESEDEMMKLLSSEFCLIVLDEITTFTWTMVSKIGSCLRVPDGSGLSALLRGGTNPIGVGAAEVKRYFISKDVTPEEDPEYHPDDYQAIHTTLDDNPFIDRQQYIRRLSNLPEHIRRAWLDGEWIVEGAYFHDYKPRIILANGENIAWHVANEMPLVPSRAGEGTLLDPFRWLQFYRAIDWGFSPDPCICLWIAALPNGRSFVLKERTWRSTTARVVAEQIVKESEGMRVVETFCDPTMFFGKEATENTSIGDIFESNGVPLTPSRNDRAAAGFAIHEYLNTILDDGLPKLQIFDYQCPMLVRTIAEMRVDKNHPEKIADGNDHYVIGLSYYCIGRPGISREELLTATPRWMRPNPNKCVVSRLGSESVR